MKILLTIIFFVALNMIISYFKNRKDPDVIAASELQMPIWRYNEYKEKSIKALSIMERCGADSPEATKYLTEIKKQVSHPEQFMLVFFKILKENEEK